MNTWDRLAFLAPLIVLSIAAIFAYLTTILLNFLGTGAIALAIILSILATLFFAVLVLFTGILLVLMLVERFNYYKFKIKRHVLDFNLYKQGIKPQTPRATRTGQQTRTPYRR